MYATAHILHTWNERTYKTISHNIQYKWSKRIYLLRMKQKICGFFFLLLNFMNMKNGKICAEHTCRRKHTKYTICGSKCHSNRIYIVVYSSYNLHINSPHAIIAWYIRNISTTKLYNIRVYCCTRIYNICMRCVIILYVILKISCRQMCFPHRTSIRARLCDATDGERRRMMYERSRFKRKAKVTHSAVYTRVNSHFLMM